MAVAPHDVRTHAQELAEENAHLAARVHELEHLLQLERSRNRGLEHGLSSLSERVMTLRRQSQPEWPHRGAAPSSG
jgi:chromosome segregation ATPase